MHDSKLIRRHTLDRAGIMFERSYLRHANISDTAQKYDSTRNGRNDYINIFGNWKKCNYAAAMIWLCTWQHFQNLIVSLFISNKIRYVWQHGK